jgi:hypothetical protein
MTMPKSRCSEIRCPHLLAVPFGRSTSLYCREHQVYLAEHRKKVTACLARQKARSAGQPIPTAQKPAAQIPLF